VETTSQTIYKLLNGRDTHWDNYFPSVQFHTNLKVSKFHNSSPYSLLFARQANHFLHLLADVTESSTMTLPETLKERLEYMTKVLYPKVFEKVTKAKKFQEEVFNQKNKMILDQFHPETAVVVLNNTRKNKNEVRYEGPFIVVRRNKGGAYILKGKDGTVYVRPPSQMKLISQEPIEMDAPPPSYINARIDHIKSHRIKDGSTQYLIQWFNIPDSYSQWVDEKNVNRTVKIQQYWRHIKDNPVPNQSTSEPPKQDHPGTSCLKRPRPQTPTPTRLLPRRK
jgi:hypothetical protein